MQLMEWIEIQAVLGWDVLPSDLVYDLDCIYMQNNLDIFIL